MIMLVKFRANLTMDLFNGYLMQVSQKYLNTQLLSITLKISMFSDIIFYSYYVFKMAVNAVY